MHFYHDGIRLWYGTSDSPAPKDVVLADTEVPITIGVLPADPSNQVEVNYRQNQGSVKTIAARHWLNSPAQRIHYFRAYLPAFQPNDKVEYSVVCYCAGRQVPEARELESFISTFFVKEVDTPSQKLRNQSNTLLQPKPTAKFSSTNSTTTNNISNLKARASEPEALSFSKESELEEPINLEINESRKNHQNIAGQIIHQGTGQLLSGFTVRAFALWNGSEAKDLGHVITDNQGLFAFFDPVISQGLASLGQQAITKSKLLLQVFNPQGGEIHRSEMPLGSVQEKVLKISVNDRSIT